MTSADEMRELFVRWKSSGQSLMAFGKAENVAYAKLLYWRRKLEGKPTRKRESPKPNLVPVRLVSDKRNPVQSSNPFEVRFANGTSIEVPTGFDEHELRRLVGVLLAC